MRLQKVLAAAGVASRRVSEQLIVEGRVRVNGVVVTELGRRIDPATDLVDVDGVAVQLDPAKRYVMLNKPRGVVSSMRDERGRPDLRGVHRRTRGAAVQRRAASTPRPAACCCSPTTATSRTCSRTRRSASTKTYIAKVRGAGDAADDRSS